MKKKDIMFQIQLASIHGASYVNDFIRNRALGYSFAEESQHSALAYNHCAGNLAKALGLAAMVWDKPEEVKIAA